MAKVVLLDAGPLGFLTHQNPPPGSRDRECQEWAMDLHRKGVTLYVPSGADYEVRRSLIRINSGESLAQLDDLITRYPYLLVDDGDWRRAGELWATARLHGISTAGDNRLDFDVVICAQAIGLERSGEKDVWIATENVGHLGLLFPRAKLWDEITPGRERS